MSGERLDQIYGKNLSNPPPGEEICITGISGKFPLSENVEEFKKNLYNRVDMVTENDRWKMDHPEIPQRSGRIPVIDQFDPGYFGVSYKQAHAMDSILRLLVERVPEALMDAGLNPSDLENSNTGVFVGVCSTESHKAFFSEMLVPQYPVITGAAKSMVANRINYLLKVRGPSVLIDTACSSSLYAAEHAFKAIREGQCEKAIVGGVNICLHPFVTLQFARLGVLSPDGSCKVFDDSANGYARSEGAIIMILEKAKDAKRIYARIIHGKTNNDGFKTQSITFPSSEMQTVLLREMYEECGVDPSSLCYLEAHGTGTQAGDPEELSAINTVFCKDRKDPLYIGSVKSNIGHSEPSSGLASIVKVLIGTENDLIPPNINFRIPRRDVEIFEKKKAIVVTESTPLKEGKRIIGVNSFGFGGSNAHLVLDCTTRKKINKGLPQDNSPRLVCVGGRTEEAVEYILNDLKDKPLDAEYIALYHNIFRKDLRGNVFRGYSIVSKTAGELCRSIQRYDYNKLPLNIVFTDFGEYWSIIGNDLTQVPVFRSTLDRIHQILSQYNLTITEILENKGSNGHLVFNKVLGTGIVQIGLVNIMKKLGIVPTTVFGCGIADFICGYFDNALTLEEAILSIYHLAKFAESLIGVRSPKGGKDKIKSNAEEFQTIKPQLLSCLKEILPKPMKRSKRWLSPNETVEFSPDTFVNSLNSVSSNHFFNYVQRRSNLLEIGIGQLKELCNKAKTFLSLEQIKTEDSFVSLLQMFGSLHHLGYDLNLLELYPKISWPVSRGTPMISSLIKWHHVREWFIPKYTMTVAGGTSERNFVIALKECEWDFMAGHVIDGRVLLPATGYLMFVWMTLTDWEHQEDITSSIVFENCKFLSALPLTIEYFSTVVVSILKSTGEFQVSEKGSLLVTGRARVVPNIEKEYLDLPQPGRKRNDLWLNSKDIYKELRLRNYNYNGGFRLLESCNVNGTLGTIRWQNGNWITFIDNMLQMRILQSDTRMLYVPTGIKKIIINPTEHIAVAEELEGVLPIFSDLTSDTIKSGGIEIHGLQATSIATRKPKGDPVLETYEFIPNQVKLGIKESIRVNLQVILENLPAFKVKVSEFQQNDLELLAPLVQQTLGDLPMITSEITVYTTSETTDLKLPGITLIKRHPLEQNKSHHLIIGYQLLNRPQMLAEIFGTLKPNAFILSREKSNTSMPTDIKNIDIITYHTTESEVLVLFRKKQQVSNKCILVDVSKNVEFDWLPKLQQAVKSNGDVLVIAQNCPLNGILGLVNCIRREPDGGNVRCVFIMDDNVPNFNLLHPLYKDQLSKSLAINVLKDSKWGTYRHLLLEEHLEVESEHCYVNTAVKGDLTSLKWFEGPLTVQKMITPETEIVAIYYSALNFRDIMLALGKINADVITKSRVEQECLQGLEFAGRTLDGRRVMGMATSGTISTIITADKSFLIPVPDDWSLEDAATTCCVYITVLQAVVVVGKLKSKNSILIHAGSGGIGLAAINLALHYGCTVYTTVGTEEKRNFLKKRFPQLKDHNIGNSRDISFEQLIMEQTKGRGVDLVLNSLAGDKLFASARCLARGGKFLEIGKFDLANNNDLSLLLLEKEASYHGIMADGFFNEVPKKKQDFVRLFKECIEAKIIKPLPRTVFKPNELETAYRYMATGKHIGKVLIQIKKEEVEKIVKPTITKSKCFPRYMCDPDHVYIILGGLGGFGLELADWLVIRGARKLILTSRQGISTGYQKLRIKSWESYSTEVHVWTNDTRTKKSCEELLRAANQIGNVAGIFNLAVVLRDSLLENQNDQTFCHSFEPKAFATIYLDELSRSLCPDLRDFVVFSSVSCGRGNAGQTNYGMANSIMERICEKRRSEGYPGLAIEWGAVGDVGLVADMQEEHVEIEIGGTLQQKISSCLQVLDSFLRQSKPIVASMVVAEKRGGAGGSENIVDIVCNIIGLKNTNVVSRFSTLPELGMDSMSAVEIKQTLEHNFDIFVSPNDLRGLTLAKLEELQEEKYQKKDIVVENNSFLLLTMYTTQAIATEPVIKLKSKVESSSNGKVPKVIMIPGIEGVGEILSPLANNLDCEVYSIQYCVNVIMTTIEEFTKDLIENMKEILDKDDEFNIVAYSYGAVIGMEAISLLEKEGYRGKIICLDGSPAMTKQVLLSAMDINALETSIILHCMSIFLSPKEVLARKESIQQSQTFEEALDLGFRDTDEFPLETSVIKMGIRGVYARTRGLLSYEPEYRNVKSEVRFFKPTTPLVSGIHEKVKLNELCSNPVEVRSFEGDHLSVLNNSQLVETINLWAHNKLPLQLDSVLK